MDIKSYLGRTNNIFYLLRLRPFCNLKDSNYASFSIELRDKVKFKEIEKKNQIIILIQINITEL